MAWKRGGVPARATQSLRPGRPWRVPRATRSLCPGWPRKLHALLQHFFDTKHCGPTSWQKPWPTLDADFIIRLYVKLQKNKTQNNPPGVRESAIIPVFPGRQTGPHCLPGAQRKHAHLLPGQTQLVTWILSYRHRDHTCYPALGMTPCKITLATRHSERRPAKSHLLPGTARRPAKSHLLPGTHDAL